MKSFNKKIVAVFSAILLISIIVVPTAAASSNKSSGDVSPEYHYLCPTDTNPSPCEPEGS